MGRGDFLRAPSSVGMFGMGWSPGEEVSGCAGSAVCMEHMDFPCHSWEHSWSGQGTAVLWWPCRGRFGPENFVA